MMTTTCRIGVGGAYAARVALGAALCPQAASASRPRARSERTTRTLARLSAENRSSAQNGAMVRLDVSLERRRVADDRPREKTAAWESLPSAHCPLAFVFPNGQS